MDTTALRRIFSAASITAAIALLAGFGPANQTRAEDSDSDDSRVKTGFQLAPVPLNLVGKNRDLVGLGSYLVNGMAACNDCHSAGPQTAYAPGGNPFFKGNSPEVIELATYLGGGRNFGSLLPGTPEIVSRNLTPDRTGRPAGGLTFAQFVHVLRTGEDRAHVHPNCSASVTNNCFPAFQPFNGDLMQIMPWPVYRNMQERDLRAIYEYLSAVPCIEGPPSGVLHNDCT